MVAIQSILGTDWAVETRPAPRLAVADKQTKSPLCLGYRPVPMESPIVVLCACTRRYWPYRMRHHHLDLPISALHCTALQALSLAAPFPGDVVPASARRTAVDLAGKKTGTMPWVLWSAAQVLWLQKVSESRQGPATTVQRVLP